MCERMKSGRKPRGRLALYPGHTTLSPVARPPARILSLAIHKTIVSLYPVLVQIGASHSRQSMFQATSLQVSPVFSGGGREPGWDSAPLEASRPGCWRTEEAECKNKPISSPTVLLTNSLPCCDSISSPFWFQTGFKIGNQAVSQGQSVCRN